MTTSVIKDGNNALLDIEGYVLRENIAELSYGTIFENYGIQLPFEVNKAVLGEIFSAELNREIKKTETKTGTATYEFIYSFSVGNDEVHSYELDLDLYVDITSLSAYEENELYYLDISYSYYPIVGEVYSYELDTDLYEFTGMGVLDTEKFYISILNSGLKFNDFFNFPSLLTWTDAVEIPKLELTVPEHRPITLLDEPISLLTWTDATDVPELSTSVLAENAIYYQLSKDNTNWVGWNGTAWVDGYEMTKLELEALTAAEYELYFSNRVFAKYEMYIKAKMSLQIPSEELPLLFETVTTNFVEGELANPLSLIEINGLYYYLDNGALVLVSDTSKDSFFNYGMADLTEVFVGENSVFKQSEHPVSVVTRVY